MDFDDIFGPSPSRPPLVRSQHNLSAGDMVDLDRVLEMGSGYVLNFSDRTFAEFFADEMGIDIDDPKFAQQGGSKGKRMRFFLRTSPPALSARLLRKLWDHREAYRTRAEAEETVPNARAKFFEIIARLEGDTALPRTDAIEKFERDVTLEELVAAIERDVQANKPEASLDRLHTYCMKRFAHLLESRGGKDFGDTLNARAGAYFNILRRTGKIRPISDRIMRATVETFEKFNYVRNNESLAHDVDQIVEPAEARFIFDSIVTMLRFVKNLEGPRFGQ